MTKLLLMLSRKPVVGVVTTVALAVVAAKLHPVLGHGTGFWDGPL